MRNFHLPLPEQTYAELRAEAERAGAELASRSGSEQSGRRPVVLVSHDGFNEVPAWKSIIVVPIWTSASQPRGGPTVVEIPAGAAGLPRASSAICHQITTLDRAKIGKRLGMLPPAVTRALETGLRAALDLD